MKKLMIAAVIVCAAAMSQAATYNWTYENGEEFEFCNLDGTKFTGTAYLFAGENYEDYFNAWDADKNVDFTTVEGYAASATFTDGLTSTKFSTEGDSQYGWAFTMVARDAAGNLFINESVGGTGSTLPAGTPLDANVGWTLDAETRAEMTHAAAEGFQDIGYYTVPEPTSGLLLLLGVAGMALRRRRA